MKKFSVLFKKYRLRAEFEKLSELADALSKEGYHYEESIFSHWQKGTRIPTQRDILIKLIHIFVERNAMEKVEDINEFLNSAGQGYLTDSEIKELKINRKSIFQVPTEIEDFTGREEILEKIKEEAIAGKTILIAGQAGVGKTTLAIKLGHILKDNFHDGIFWYRLDNSKIEDIFVAIAHLLEEDLPQSNDIQVNASFIRALLSQKRVLLIFDNVEKENKLHLLLPHSNSSSILILSKQKNIYLPGNIVNFCLDSFTDDEALTLFKKCLEEKYIAKYKKTLLQLSIVLGNLPLAIHLIASQLKQSNEDPTNILKTFNKENSLINDLKYENKTLYTALNISYKNLSKKTQAVFLSLGVFEGKDFSIEAIAYMNGSSNHQSKEILQELYDASLIELSINSKYRIHPVIKKYIAEKLNNPRLPSIMKITYVLFGSLTLFWLLIQDQKPYFDYSRLFSAIYFVVPLWGSFWGIKIANKYGRFSSMMGKTFLFFSLGLLCQTIGQFIYSIYDNLLHIDTPYPSLGDFGYFASMICYLYGIYFFAKLCNVKYNFSLVKNNRVVFISAIIVWLLSFGIIIKDYHLHIDNLLKVILDFAYPFGDGIYVILALLLFVELQRAQKNIMKSRVLFFLIALLAAFLSDFVFIIEANLGDWQAGDINDYMYLTSYLLMTVAILKLNSHSIEVIKK